MHVRHGDKFIETQPYPFSRYMKELKKNWPHVKRVFIASDDKYVFFEASLNEEYKEYQFMFINEMKFHKEGWELFRSLLCEIYILSECDYFLGTLTSNLGRLAWELMHAKKPTAQVVSLDSPWYGSP